MDATPLLKIIAEALKKSKLEAILIGNAAAALQGAPVTTIDFDFVFRKTPTNLTKLKKFASILKAYIMRPYYPASDLYRVINESSGLQVDFMSRIHGVKSFASLRSRSEKLKFKDFDLVVASLNDIIKSKTIAGRPQDLAVLPVLEKTLYEKEAIKEKNINKAKGLKKRPATKSVKKRK